MDLVGMRTIQIIIGLVVVLGIVGGATALQPGGLDPGEHMVYGNGNNTVVYANDSGVVWEKRSLTNVNGVEVETDGDVVRVLAVDGEPNDSKMYNSSGTQVDSWGESIQVSIINTSHVYINNFSNGNHYIDEVGTDNRTNITSEMSDFGVGATSEVVMSFNIGPGFESNKIVELDLDNGTTTTYNLSKNVTVGVLAGDTIWVGIENGTMFRLENGESTAYNVSVDVGDSMFPVNETHWGYIGDSLGNPGNVTVYDGSEPVFNRSLTENESSESFTYYDGLMLSYGNESVRTHQFDGTTQSILTDAQVGESDDRQYIDVASGTTTASTGGSLLGLGSTFGIPNLLIGGLVVAILLIVGLYALGETDTEFV
jgi:hypothetical protein